MMMTEEEEEEGWKEGGGGHNCSNTVVIQFNILPCRLILHPVQCQDLGDEDDGIWKIIESTMKS